LGRQRQRIAPAPCQDADGDPDCRGQKQRAGTQQRSTGRTLGDELADRASVLCRFAEVEANRLPEPRGVLQQKGAIQPEPVPLGGGSRRIQVEA
jgi:hypothetical protein